ncbi:cofactor vestigial 4 [Podarcis lilfordi]|uniref:Cofactor vestigial 4 n=1 Tax=Podarcis lilfordi TaxID=74358 RepID=A0AA35PS40_9SAUR|nr:cofactor vestigial 4 [Podarcis lilfordi]
MALADLHYTTGISSGFKVYILEGQSSFENEPRFPRFPAHRLPVYAIKRKPSVDVRSPERSLHGQRASKVKRSTCGPVAASLEQRVPPAAQIPIAVPCVTMSRPEPCRDSQALHPSCPHKCPLRKPLLEPALTVSQLQQMRPSVITCVPRRSWPEKPESTSPAITPSDRRSTNSDPAPPQRLHAWTTGSVGPSAQVSREASPKQRIQRADKNPIPSA